MVGCGGGSSSRRSGGVVHDEDAVEMRLRKKRGELRRGRRAKKGRLPGKG
jgi:hypothetical protein